MEARAAMASVAALLDVPDILVGGCRRDGRGELELDRGTLAERVGDTVALPSGEGVARGVAGRRGNEGSLVVPAIRGDDGTGGDGAGEGDLVFGLELPRHTAGRGAMRVGEGVADAVGRLDPEVVLQIGLAEDLPAGAPGGNRHGRVRPDGFHRAGDGIVGGQAVMVAVGRQGRAVFIRNARDFEDIVEAQAIVVAEERH